MDTPRNGVYVAELANCVSLTGVIADGAATGKNTSAGVGVGAAVAVSVATVTTAATIGTGASVTAGSLAGTAGMLEESTPLPLADVDSAADTIDLGGRNGIDTGDALVYGNGGGASVGGLTDGETYYAIVDDTRTPQPADAAALLAQLRPAPEAA